MEMPSLQEMAATLSPDVEMLCSLEHLCMPQTSIRLSVTESSVAGFSLSEYAISSMLSRGSFWQIVSGIASLPFGPATHGRSDGLAGLRLGSSAERSDGDTEEQKLASKASPAPSRGDEISVRINKVESQPRVTRDAMEVQASQDDKTGKRASDTVYQYVGIEGLERALSRLDIAKKPVDCDATSALPGAGETDVDDEMLWDDEQDTDGYWEWHEETRQHRHWEEETQEWIVFPTEFL
ncbi:hypothetical protein B0I35DRAFT_52740 [Stachybotrys elegans]|uniref:Uncharacterized protein n=1 Tax=Stachybotrys elegans TaxID=80388 RepID=A0A8K0SMA8_9HYPO|nr:hypothetical protein B0I35DRAFT_52740 [Stachybotrys elegans]